MKKNGIKNFIFSFLLSLLAVVAVNKAVFHTIEPIKTAPNKTKNQIKTISLFSKQKNNSGNDESSRFAAIEDLVSTQEKVTENALPDIDISDAQKIKPTTKINNNKSKSIIVYQEQHTDKQHLPETANKHNTSSMHEPYINLATASEITLEKEQAVVNETPKSLSANNVIYADISDTIKDEQNQTALQNEILYAPEPIDKSSNIILAQADNILENSEDLIPLTENQELLHENINVLTSADTTQIAMLEPNTLINSFESLDKPEEKHIAEINLKKDNITTNTWTQMANTEQKDNPWVVAKGNRFAKNKIAQVDALTQDEKDETVTNENLEDNLQEDTLTPQEVVENDTINVSNEQDVDINIEQQSNVDTSDKNKTLLNENNASQHIQEQVSENTAKENIITIHKDDKISSSSAKDTIPEAPKEVVADFSNSHISLNMSVSSQEDDNNEQELIPQESILSPKPLLIPTDGSGTKLAYKMIQNLIIPLPEDVVNDADIIPELSSEPNQKPVEKPTTERNKNKKEIKKEEKESGLFKSISSWFSGNNKDNKKAENEAKDTQKNNKKTRQNKKSGISLFEVKQTPDLEENDIQIDTPEIMPAELKLSFQPNRAEISGHTLRWIHAFADNARDNNGIYIEIRIDGTSSFALQQKRLNLLSSIFANRGVDFRKVNIIFTSREPNSFIIRNIRFNNNEEVIINENDRDANYQYW